MDSNPFYELIKERLIDIDEKELFNDVDNGVSVKETEKTMTYFWIRIYLKEEATDVLPGDPYRMSYKEEENLDITFSTYGRKNERSSSDDDGQVAEYVTEEDKKCLIFLVDEEKIRHNSEDIPFVRTLFRSSPWFEYQVYRRNELSFTNLRTGITHEYVDANL